MNKITDKMVAAGLAAKVRDYRAEEGEELMLTVEHAMRIYGFHHPIDGSEMVSAIIEAALAATGKQQVGEVQGDALDEVGHASANRKLLRTVRAQGDRIAELEAALAARQPGAQEPQEPQEPQVPVCSGGFVIGNGSGEKYMAWGQVGPEWVADRSSALWLVRRADAEALAAENEDAWLILPVERCALPPNGWACTLASGHEGPCPTIAAPPAQGIDLGQFRDRIKAAIDRIVNHQCLMRIPVDNTDPDIVLADILRLIDGQRDAAPGVSE